MPAPFTDIRVEYMDTPERRVFDLRPDGIPEVPMLGWCGYSHARPDLPTHHHTGVLEIHFLERGRQVFEVEGQEYELHGGDVFVTQPGESHSTGGRPVEPCMLYWVNVRLPKAGQPLFLLPREEAAEVVEALRSLPSRHISGSPLVKTLFDRLLDLHANPEAILRRTRLRQAMVQLLLEVIDNSARRVVGDPGTIIRDIMRTIESRPAEEFRIKDLARVAGYSLSWFKMRFKAETGLSPRQFILRTKVDAACRRLLSSADPIGQIAGDLGFPTSQYFATVFRRLMRMSPRRYREAGVRPQGPSHREEDGQV